MGLFLERGGGWVGCVFHLDKYFIYLLEFFTLEQKQKKKMHLENTHIQIADKMYICVYND